MTTMIMTNNKVDSLTSVAVTTYLFHMVKPKLLLLAILMFAVSHETSLLQTVNGAIHTEVTNGRELHIRNPTRLLSRIEFEPASNQQLDDDVPAVGPFIGNAEFVQPEMSIKKKDCEMMPSIVSRGLLGSTMKRSYFAANADELEAKMRKEEHMIKKRNADISSDAPLPWTCETNYEWKDMGSDHYPRFVRTAECKSKFCVRGFYRCKPRRYKTKILKRNIGTESNTCEEDDVSLPETLRSSWRFITVTINLCCDCTGPGRLLGVEI